MLSEISLGSYFFHIGLLLRDTNLINAVLFGAEAWYGITKKQMEEIDRIDIMFMKKLFNAKNNVAKEIYYLESGKLPAKFILISRRLNFLRHIINSDKNGLLFKFYSIQKDCPVKNDWVLQVEIDRKEINLDLSDDDFTSLSKWQFKKTLKKKIYEAATNHLNTLAENHSKSRPLMKSEIKCEPYISDMRFKTHEVQLLFSLRSRTYPVKSNMKNKYKDDLLCNLCRSAVCEQEHLLRCAVLQEFVPELRNTKVMYSDIFGRNVEAQLAAVKLFDLIDKQRELVMDALDFK